MKPKLFSAKLNQSKKKKKLAAAYSTSQTSTVVEGGPFFNTNPEWVAHSSQVSFTRKKERGEVDDSCKKHLRGEEK